MSDELAALDSAGIFLAEELDARGWTQAEFADILGRPPQVVSEIIAGKKEITRESATQIAAALDTSPELWLNLQNQYLLRERAKNSTAQSELAAVRLRARMQQLAPMQTLVERGYIRGQSAREQADEIKAFYRLDDIQQEPQLRIAARRSSAADAVSKIQKAWVYCVVNLAVLSTLRPFSPPRLESLASGLTSNIRVPTDFARLPRLFGEAGVSLVYVEAFPGSKMDGCALILHGHPVIGISGRGKRFDKVLFTVLHEAAHVVLDHLAAGAVIDDQDSPSTLGSEDDANELAGKWAIPYPLPPIPQKVTGTWIGHVAQSQGVHPMMVIGRLQNDGCIPWKTSLVRNAPTVANELSRW